MAGLFASTVLSMWTLDQSRRHLNHGSFGATPIAVLEKQAEWIRQLESSPPRFMINDLPEALDRARRATARFVGGDEEGLVFVRNASTGVASVLRSMEPFLGPGDEIVTNAHDYNAVRQMLRFLEARIGVIIRVAQVPFPVRGPQEVAAAVLNQLTERTRLVVIDHITSPTGLIFPVEKIVDQLEPDVPVLVDGAHGPGQVPLDLGSLGASWYTGNLHKWVCAPKGAGFLLTRSDRRDMTIPTVISHGWNAKVPTGSSRYRMLFDWLGTDDFSPWLVVPDAIDVMASTTVGGWPALMERNHRLILNARERLLARWPQPEPAPAPMVGSMATIFLPDSSEPDPGGELSPLMGKLDRDGFEVIVSLWPAWPRQLLRVSAHVYNDLDEYEALVGALIEPSS